MDRVDFGHQWRLLRHKCQPRVQLDLSPNLRVQRDGDDGNDRGDGFPEAVLHRPSVLGLQLLGEALTRVGRVSHLLRLFACVALGGLILSACYSGNPSGPTVGILGDSITALTKSSTEAALEPSYAVDVEFWFGLTIGAGLPVIANMISTEHPQRWVLDLGTSDAEQNDLGLDPSWAANLKTEITDVGYSSCVVLVNINTNADTNHGHVGTVAVQLDEALAYVAAVDPHFRLVDWNAQVHQPGNAGWLYSDGIHPTALGQQELAADEGAALARCPVARYKVGLGS